MAVVVLGILKTGRMLSRPVAWMSWTSAARRSFCAGVPVVDGLGDARADGLDVFLGRAGVGHVGLGVEVCAVFAQFSGLLGECLDPLAAGRFGHAAVFEREQVALDGFLDFGKVGFGDGEFVAELLLALCGA